MKRNFLALLPIIQLFSFNSSVGQVNVKTLSKYSYPIFTVTNRQQHTGTAFFYRDADTSYLVSNYHAIKGMSPLKQEIAFDADTLYLKYPVVNSSELKIISIDISADMIGKTEVFSMVNRIDLLKIPITLPDDADIHFINDFIDTSYLDAIPEEIIAFGFPTNPGAIPEFYSRQQRLQGQVNTEGFSEYDASLKNSYPEASDSARAILNGTSRYYFFIRPYAPQGYSGSPVFGKFRTADNKVVYRFFGVIFAGQPNTKQTWTIKGAVALQYLQI